MDINNDNNIYLQQQFRSPTSRAARWMKEIGLDSLDICPIGQGENKLLARKLAEI